MRTIPPRGRLAALLAAFCAASGSLPGCVAYDIRDDLRATRESLTRLDERVANIERTMTQSERGLGGSGETETLMAAVNRLDKNLAELRKAVEGMIDTIPTVDVDKLKRQREGK